MLKVAIIGAGAISGAHIEGYGRFKDRCQIVAISDVYPEKARAKAEQFGLDAKVMQDYRELLEEGIDLVSICTPPYVHAEIAIDFLNAGSHVIIEKPMASSLKECDDINEAARKNGKIVSVIAQNRFRNPMMKLKSVLDSGLAGKILHTQADSFWWRGHCYYDLWWRGTWEKDGGGPTLNHAVHHIDALLWMRGRPSHVQAYMSNVAHDNAEIEDLSIAMLRYPDGTLGQVTSFRRPSRGGAADRVPRSERPNFRSMEAFGIGFDSQRISKVGYGAGNNHSALLRRLAESSV